MMVMTAKVHKKKLVLILAGAVLLLGALVWLFGGSGTAPTAAASLASNEGRLQFLRELGWEAAATPKESGQVRIPEPGDPVFDRYNQLQLSQGYDLSAYAGNVVMRYVYKLSNYPGATDPVYLTLLLYKDQVIGGDITDTSAAGAVRPFKNTTKPGA